MTLSTSFKRSAISSGVLFFAHNVLNVFLSRFNSMSRNVQSCVICVDFEVDTHSRGHVVGRKAGTCCRDSFPRVSRSFLRKISVAGTKLTLRTKLQ